MSSSCDTVKRGQCRTGRNTHGTVLGQQPSLLYDCRIDPRAAGDNRSCWKLASKRSLDPKAVLNQDKGITVVKQLAKKIGGRYDIGKGSASS